uniref:Uncharacterized protein n=1 Tax=Salix viminalis TaxID=40686 RepID=A0A6N2LMH8_SALVM
MANRRNTSIWLIDGTLHFYVYNKLNFFLSLQTYPSHSLQSLSRRRQERKRSKALKGKESWLLPVLHGRWRWVSSLG